MDFRSLYDHGYNSTGLSWEMWAEWKDNQQWCKSVTFCYGSRSAPLTNGSGSGSGSCYFLSLTFKTNKKYFSASYFLKVYLQYLHHVSKIKVTKKSQNSMNQGFSYYFPMMIEGSGSGYVPLWLMDTDPDPGGPKTYGCYGSATLLYSNGSDTYGLQLSQRIFIWVRKP